MSDRIVGDILAIKTDGLPIEEIGQGLVGRGWISERAGRQGDTAHKIVTQLAVESEAHSYPPTVAVLKGRNILKKALTANPDVAVEPEPA